MRTGIVHGAFLKLVWLYDEVRAFVFDHAHIIAPFCNPNGIAINQPRVAPQCGATLGRCPVKINNPERVASVDADDPTPSGLSAPLACSQGSSQARNPGLNDGIPLGFGRHRRLRRMTKASASITSRGVRSILLVGIACAVLFSASLCGAQAVFRFAVGQRRESRHAGETFRHAATRATGGAAEARRRFPARRHLLSARAARVHRRRIPARRTRR